MRAIQTKLYLFNPTAYVIFALEEQASYVNLKFSPQKN